MLKNTWRLNAGGTTAVLWDNRGQAPFTGSFGFSPNFVWHLMRAPENLINWRPIKLGIIRMKYVLHCKITRQIILLWIAYRFSIRVLRIWSDLLLSRWKLHTVSHGTPELYRNQSEMSFNRLFWDLTRAQLCVFAYCDMLCNPRVVVLIQGLTKRRRSHSIAQFPDGG